MKADHSNFLPGGQNNGESFLAASIPATSTAGEDYAHPSIPAPALWAGVMLIVILLSFVTAMLVGTVVKANMEE